MSVRRFLDLILPPTAEDRLIRDETSASIKRLYIPHYPKTHEAVASYREPVIKALITANKFQANRHASHLLATLLAVRLLHFMQTVAVIPIPTAPERVRTRGHDHMQTILSYLPPALPTAYRPTILPGLKRIRHTVQQTTLQKDDRIRNLQGAFLATRAVATIPSEQPVVIIDDVVTTGATLSEAKRALQNHLPAHTIHTLAVAH